MTPHVLAPTFSLEDRGATRRCAISSDGSTILSTTKSKDVRVWTLEKEGYKNTTSFSKHEEYTRQCALTNDGTLAATVSPGAVRVWSTSTGKQTFKIKRPSGYFAAGCALTPNGSVLVACFRKYLTMSNVGSIQIYGAQGNFIRAWDLDFQVKMCFVSDDGARIAFKCMNGGETCVMRVMDAVSGTYIPVSGRVTEKGRLAMDGAGKLLVIADAIQLQLCNVEDGSQQLIFQGYTPAEIQYCDISRDGKRVAASVAGNAFQVWDASEGTLLARLEGHTDIVQSCAITHNGKWVTTCSLDSKVHVWDLHSIDPQDTVEKKSQAVHVSPILKLYHNHRTRVCEASTEGVLAALLEMTSSAQRFTCQDVYLGHLLVKYIRFKDKCFHDKIPDDSGPRTFFNKNLYSHLITLPMSKSKKCIAEFILKEANEELKLLSTSDIISIQNSMKVVDYVNEKFASVCQVLYDMYCDYSDRLNAVEAEMNGVRRALIQIKEEKERARKKQMVGCFVKLGLCFIPVVGHIGKDIIDTALETSSIVRDFDVFFSIDPKDTVSVLTNILKEGGNLSVDFTLVGKSDDEYETAAIQLGHMGLAEEFLQQLPASLRDMITTMIRESQNMTVEEFRSEMASIVCSQGVDGGAEEHSAVSKESNVSLEDVAKGRYSVRLQQAEILGRDGLTHAEALDELKSLFEAHSVECDALDKVLVTADSDVDHKLTEEEFVEATRFAWKNVLAKRKEKWKTAFVQASRSGDKSVTVTQATSLAENLLDVKNEKTQGREREKVEVIFQSHAKEGRLLDLGQFLNAMEDVSSLKFLAACTESDIDTKVSKSGLCTFM